MNRPLKTFLIFVIALLSIATALSQAQVAVELSTGPAEVIGVSPWPGGVLLTLKDRQRADFISGPRPKSHYRMEVYLFDAGFERLRPAGVGLPAAPRADVGSGYFSPADSVLYFGSAWDFEDNRPAAARRIYSARMNKDGRFGLPLLMPGVKSAAHPWLSQDGMTLFFSAENGASGMDILYRSRTDDAWSGAVLFGDSVSGRGHELFPSEWNGTVYFSRHAGDRSATLETSGKTAWHGAIPADPSFALAGNGLQLCRLDAHRAYYTADDSTGKGRLYFLENHTAKREIRFQSVCRDHGLEGAMFEVRHPSGARLATARSGPDGDFSFWLYESDRPLLIAPIGVTAAEPCLELRVLSPGGKGHSVLRRNERGEFIFEILPTDMTATMKRAANPDEFQLLSFRLEGTLRDADQAPLAEVIHIVNDRGEIERTAEADATGRFVFEKATPTAEIRLMPEPDSRVSRIEVEEAGRSHALSADEDGAYVYDRPASPGSADITDANGRVLRIYPGEDYRLAYLTYEFDSDRLGPDSEPTLKMLVKMMKQNPALRVTLASHTDSRGSADYNLRLSQRRADSAKQRLIALGIAPARISAIGYGESQLLNGCDDRTECTEDQHALNRRTEVRLE